MDEVFPLRTYTGRRRRVVSQKPTSDTAQHLASEQSENGPKIPDKNTSTKRQISATSNVTRKKRLKSSKARTSRRVQGEKTRSKQKTSEASMKKQDLTFGMFGSDGECKADDLTSEDVQTTEGIRRMEPEAETETLPATEMGGQDKVSEWLSAQNGEDCSESSIEVMREEVITAAERKEKHFRGKFFENINKVINIATDLGQQADKKHTFQDLSLEDIPLVDSPVTGKTTTGTGLESTDPQTYQGTEPGIELGTYTVSTNQRSSAVTDTVTYTTSTGRRSSAVTETGTYTLSTNHRSSAVTETETYTMSTNKRSETAPSSKTSKRSTEYYTEEVTDSVEEKEKSEKTPGKRTSFVVPRSPVKKHTAKPGRKSSEILMPRSSTRLFQTNIDQTNVIPDLSSIHGDADREGRLISSEVSAGDGHAKLPIPLTPEIQMVNKQPVPRLTSTPTRKTSTPNSDACQLARFEIELSSVSAVHSDEEGLILHQSVRDVVSDEHIDLSKTRIDEHFGEYDKQHLKDIGGNKIPRSTSSTKGAVNRSSNKSVEDCDTVLRFDINTDHDKRKQIVKGHVLRRKFSQSRATKNMSQHKKNTSTKNMDSHRSELAQTVINHKQTSLMYRLFKPSTDGLSLNSHTSSLGATAGGLSLSSFKSFFRLKRKDPNQKKKNRESMVKENLPVCSLGGDFVCPVRETLNWAIHRDGDVSLRDRRASLPKDDLNF